MGRWDRASNHGQISDLPGRWLTGRIRGALVEAGWGATLGYPGLVLDADGPVLDVATAEGVLAPSTDGASRRREKPRPTRRGCATVPIRYTRQRLVGPVFAAWTAPTLTLE